MAKREQPDQKMLELKRTGTLNPHPDAMTDLLFKENPFFDPRDLLQVRYEMLRRHTAEKMSILDAAATFGVSRPTFYQAQAAFNRSGLAGLLPSQRGPKGGHKVTAEVLDYVANLRAAEPAADDRSVHASRPATLWGYHPPPQSGAGSGASKKKLPGLTQAFAKRCGGCLREASSHLVDPTDRPASAVGRVVLLRRGMLAWASDIQAVCRLRRFRLAPPGEHRFPPGSLWSWFRSWPD